MSSKLGRPLAALALTLAAGGVADAHDLRCDKTVDGDAIEVIGTYPAFVTWEMTVRNVNPSDPSTALAVSDPMLQTAGWSVPFDLPLTLEVDEAVNATFGMAIDSFARCAELAHAPTGGTVSVNLDNVFSVGWDVGTAQCTARIICSPPASPTPDNPTRTMAFFAIHEQALQRCLDVAPIDLGFIRISTLERALGLLWGSPMMFPDHSPRDSLDRARFLLGRQTLVGVCNRRLFGSTPAPSQLLDEGVAALSGLSCGEMSNLEERIAAFNDSGAAVPLPAGFDPGPATPTDAAERAVDPTEASGQTCRSGAVCTLLLPAVPQMFVFESPTWAVAGDFDGDGKADLVLIYAFDGVRLLLRGQGNGTFVPKTPFASDVGPFPFSIVSGDFNGDGRADLAVANGLGVNVILGNGDGTFRDAVTYRVNPGDRVETADFDGDGKPDLLGTGGDTINVLLGNGDGTFQDAVASETDGHLVSAVAGDFNGDGRADVVVGHGAAAPDRDNTLSMRLGNGDGTFETKVSYPLAGLPQSIVTADFNRDGKIDLAVTETSFGAGVDASLAVFLGNGDGMFQPAVRYALDPGSEFVTTADLDGDGNLDIAVTNRVFSTITVLEGNGDGSFRDAVDYLSSEPEMLAIADFNGDGKMDLAAAETQSAVSVLLGDEHGLRAPVNHRPAGFPAWVAGGDFNGDGVPDLAAVTQNPGEPDRVSVLLNNGNGTLRDGASYAAMEGGPLASGDFNRDGATDLAVVGNGRRVHVLLGKGDGTFEPKDGFTGVVAQPGAGPVAVRIPGAVGTGDLNGDGNIDLVIANRDDDSVSVLLGNGDGSFQAAVDYGTGEAPVSLALTDLDGDGRLDVVVANSAGDDVSVLLGAGDGTFETEARYPAGVTALSVDTGDLDLDGHIDVLVAGFAVDVLVGNGDGSLQPPPRFAQSLGSAVVAADLNGDGFLDMASTGDPSVVVRATLGIGDTTFRQELSQYDGGFRPRIIGRGDFNADGRMDLVVIGDGVSILINEGCLP